MCGQRHISTMVDNKDVLFCIVLYFRKHFIQNVFVILNVINQLYKYVYTRGQNC